MTSTKTFYITTPLYYVNSPLTVGGAYTTIVADVVARYQRSRGRKVFFLTGSDEHGQKIARAAEEQGIAPQELADRVVGTFRDLWKTLAITCDDFIRTTEDRHGRVVQEAFRRLRAQGDIYWGKYQGWYCTPCETFFLPSQIAGGLCPECARPVEKLEEENWFFRLSAYQKRLEEHFAAHPDFVRPPSRYNEMANRLSRGLNDISVSRSVGWGVPVPEGGRQVCWVWFDALLNYISAPGAFGEGGSFASLWPADLHLMAKDIVWFHAVLWPALLFALELPPPKCVFAHGWWTFGGEKISKSKGTKIFAREMAEEYGADALRYFLLREIPLGLDGDFSLEAFRARYRSDLAHDLGNLLQRTLAMIKKFRGGRIPTDWEGEGGGGIRERARALRSSYDRMMENLELSRVLEGIWSLVALANRYIEDSKPWALNKDEGSRRRLDGVLFNLVFALIRIAEDLDPFLPATAQGIRDQIGPGGGVPAASAKGGGGETAIVPAGGEIGSFQPLFPLKDEE
jgi:methionyl-tRNA synthetase